MSLSRSEAEQLGTTHARAQARRVRAALPAAAGAQAHSYLLASLMEHDWKPHAWVVDAIQAAYELGQQRKA